MAMGFKPGAKQRVIPFAKSSESGDTELRASPAGNLSVVFPTGGSALDGISNASTYFIYRDIDAGFAPVIVPLLYNNNTWDRFRNNAEITLLESATRNSDTASPYQTNYNARGVVIYLNVTAVPGTDTITLG